MHKNNSAKIYTGSSGGELKISLNNTKQVISASNNRAQYYAELAEKYKNEAKEHRDNAQFYAEQNSDVTLDYIDGIKVDLENKINTKQDLGDYALKQELPTKVTELLNDAEYTTFDAVIPEQRGNEKRVLCTDGNNLYWETNTSFRLFDLKISDFILDGEDSIGWALQGSYVYKSSVDGSRVGYPDFYDKVLEEKSNSTQKEIVLGDSTITVFVHSNGHQFYDISDKTIIDNWFETYGTAWFYGVDEENERIFLPRNNYFEQMTINPLEVGNSVQAGLPNIQATVKGTGGYNSASGAFKISNSTHRGTGTDSSPTTLTFDASLSNPIYGKSETVQPNSVKKLLYICVGNTFVKSSLSEFVEITSSENDILPLFTAQYFDFQPNNISWIKAGEQINGGGGIYAFIYNELVNELISPKYNLKVVETKAMLDDVDYSEYWKINQDEFVFITPTKSILNASGGQLYFKIANAVENIELLDAGAVLEAVNNININSINKTNSTDINTVLSWIMPDYTNSILISVTSTTSYTAPTNGYLFGSFNFAGSTEGLVYINGVPIGTSNQSGQISVIPVAKGDVLTAVGTENDQVYFCPMKGVN